MPQKMPRPLKMPSPLLQPTAPIPASSPLPFPKKRTLLAHWHAHLSPVGQRKSPTSVSDCTNRREGLLLELVALRLLAELEASARDLLRGDLHVVVLQGRQPRLQRQLVGLLDFVRPLQDASASLDD